MDYSCIMIETLSYQTYYWPRCSSCIERIGPYFSMKEAQRKVRERQQCVACSAKSRNEANKLYNQAVILRGKPQ